MSYDILENYFCFSIGREIQERHLRSTSSSQESENLPRSNHDIIIIDSIFLRFSGTFIEEIRSTLRADDEEIFFRSILHILYSRKFLQARKYSGAYLDDSTLSIFLLKKNNTIEFIPRYLRESHGKLCNNLFVRILVIIKK